MSHLIRLLVVAVIALTGACSASLDAPQGPQGEQGRQGASGTSCWDLDGDGKGSTDEDVNADDVFDALDCVGPQGAQGNEGPQGPQGEQGVQGAPGRNGLACWDTNGNDVGDDDEDANADGSFDALDCVGQRGEPGPQGDQGIQGLPGADGASIVAISLNVGDPDCPHGGAMFTDGTGNNTFACSGADGVEGPQGEQGIQGAPGRNGLACWDTNGNDVGDDDEDTNADGSFDALDCVGQRGEPGPQGDQGIQGLPGADGASIVAISLNVGDPDCPHGGAMFADGTGNNTFACNGADGAAGPQGEQGPQGIQGERGAQGLQGEPGDSGIPDNVVTVGPGAGASFATLQEAMATLTGLDGSSRVQVLVSPGFYGGSALTIPPFVDVIGSSTKATVITASVGVSGNVTLRHLALTSSGQGAALTIQGGSAETVLDDVEITRTGAGAENHQAVLIGAATVRLRNVRLAASGGSTAHALFAHPGPTTIEIHDSTLSASGAFSNYGIQLGFTSSTSGSTLRIVNSEISANGGVGDVAALWVDGSHSVTVLRSTLQSSSQYLHIQGGGPNVTARFCELRGRASVADGSMTCIASIDQSDSFLATGCPTTIAP